MIEQAKIERGEKWYKVLAYWELRRIPYNLIMLLGGIASIAIFSVTIPILYILAAIVFNIGYSFLWLIDLQLIKRKNIDRSKKIFRYYIFISLGLVLIIPISMLIILLLSSVI